MRSGAAFLTGAGIGAGLVYLLDPERGRRHLTLVRDRATSAFGRRGETMSTAARDLASRTRSAMAEVRARFRGEHTPDEVLAARVDETLGHLTAHPRAIEVTAKQGAVTLAGPILASEVEVVLRAVRRVRGVRAVDSLLEVHEHPGDVPGLQGGADRRLDPPEAAWSPVARVLLGAVGTGLVASGGIRRGPVGAALGVLGLGVLARAAANADLRRLAGMRGEPVDVRRTIAIAAPVDTVFEFWRSYENFPRFMSHVREARDLGGGRSRWVVAGPAGVRFQWDAEITEMIPNQVLAWRSTSGPGVRHAGRVQFRPCAEGTRLDVWMAYHPPAGAIGQSIAKLLGADPETEIDADLERLKALVESGGTPPDTTRPAG